MKDMTHKQRVYAALTTLHGPQAHLIAADVDVVDALNMDSLDMVEAVMAVEDEFGIEILDEEVSIIGNTINSIAAYVGGKLAEVKQKELEFDPSTGFPITNIDRFEVIDHRTISGKPGRVVVASEMKLEVSIQDNGRTIKVFLSD